MATIARAKGGGRGRGHGILLAKGLMGNASRCYSLSKPEMCEGDAPANATCTIPDEDHKDARASSRFCGTRVERTNPCWSYEGRERCMPHFFLLGEMKCGTTTLYKKLLEHPQVVPPRNNEVRYLQQPKYRKHTGTWYASNFDSVVDAPPDAVTFDASPTAFNAQVRAHGSQSEQPTACASAERTHSCLRASWHRTAHTAPPAGRHAPQAIAPGWTAKWLPEARLVVMLRDPVQRTYSHFLMGVDWLKASKVAPPTRAQAAARRAGCKQDDARPLGSVGATLSRTTLRRPTASSPSSGRFRCM